MGDRTLGACGNGWPYFGDYNNSIDQTQFGLECDEMKRRCNAPGCPVQLGELCLKFLTFYPYFIYFFTLVLLLIPTVLSFYFIGNFVLQ